MIKKYLLILLFLILITEAKSQIPDDSCYRSTHCILDSLTTLLMDNRNLQHIKTIDNVEICNNTNTTREFIHAQKKWADKIKKIKSFINTEFDSSSDNKIVKWKKNLQDLFNEYNTEWIELEKFFHPDSTAVRVKDIHNNYFKRDSANNNISYIDSSFKTTGIYLSDISNKSTQIKHITDTTLSRTDTILKKVDTILYRTDAFRHFIQSSFYNDGIAGVGYFYKRKSDTITKKIPINFWVQFIIPYNSPKTTGKNNFGGMIATGLMKKQFNFLAGVVYQDADVYENISWIISGHYFSNGWGIGASYSPLLKAGLHVFKSVGK